MKPVPSTAFCPATKNWGSSPRAFPSCTPAKPRRKRALLKLGFTHPLPMKKIAAFVKSVKRCLVIEEGDPYLVEAIRAAGIKVEGKAEMYRFGERQCAARAADSQTTTSPPNWRSWRASRRNCATRASIGLVFEALRQRDALWRATSVATRWAC